MMFIIWNYCLASITFDGDDFCHKIEMKKFKDKGGGESVIRLCGFNIQ